MILTRCPSEATLATLAEGRLVEKERAELAPHLAHCELCLDRVAFLARQVDEPAEARVPDQILERAESVASSRDGRSPWSRPAAWGAIAALLVAAVSLPWINDYLRSSEEDRRLRNAPMESRVGPVIEAPSDGSVLTRSSLLFRWREVPGRLFYTVTVLTADGDLVAEKRTESTMIHLSPHLDVEPNKVYYFWVSAHLPEGRVVRSASLAFTVSEQVRSP